MIDVFDDDFPIGFDVEASLEVVGTNSSTLGRFMAYIGEIMEETDF